MGVSYTPPQTAINTGALMEIMGSSESVAGRIAAFQKAKQEADEAFAALKIGQDAKAAFDAANAVRAAADARLIEANTAADEAIHAMGDANGKAQAIVAQAEAQAQSILADIESQRLAHRQWMDAGTADIEVQKARAAAEGAKLAADAAQVLANEALIRAQEAQEHARELAVRAQAPVPA